jgi:transcriptional regulator of acetoin/glycerol metabolism
VNGTTASPKTREIWQEFTEGRNTALEVIDPLIRDSWMRARQQGLDATMKAVPVALTPAQLQPILEKSRLHQAASWPIRMISSALKGRSIIVLLLDANGVLLKTVGEPNAMQKAAEIGCIPGCQMTEDTIGTDAISCSLALHKPVNVAFSEHYIEVGHAWAGSATPIYQPFTHDLLGCLSIYGHGDAAHPAALEFTVEAGQMVEHELETLETRARLILLEKYEFHRTRFPNDQSLCISRDGIAFAGSPGALNLMGFPQASIGDFRGFLQVVDIPGIGFEGRLESRQVQLRTKRGDLLKADLLPVVHDRELVGFVGVIPGARGSARQSTSSKWSASYTFAEIIHGESKLRECISEAEKIAREDWPVLITGESGTGKELFAHAIHNASARNTGPFVAVNCGGLNDELLSAEIFGYSEGAFTGAARGGRAGKMELANGGTLFLDEAEAMSPRMQIHLLRVLEERRVVPVGAEKPRPVDVRVVAATNVDLEQKIKDGCFRRDLYYRLSGLSIVVPPLRERAADIPIMTQHFLAELGDLDVDPAAMERLQSYCWPGNVRQLRNVLQQAATRAKGGIIVQEDLSAAVCVSACLSADCGFLPERSVPSVSHTRLRQVERKAIVGALRECEGNVSRAASVLGIHRVTLHRKIGAMGITIGRTFA